MYSILYVLATGIFVYALVLFVLAARGGGAVFGLPAMACMFVAGLAVQTATLLFAHDKRLRRLEEKTYAADSDEAS